tara:strand:- start:48 stop:773 length:726 start_codon:yes stop_codon:yes gene_type:complete
MRSKANRRKHYQYKLMRKREVKFCGFVYRLHNGCLKKHEMEELGDKIRRENYWLGYCYDPIVFISQEYIDKHFKSSRHLQKIYIRPAIEVYVDCPFANPYAGHYGKRWVIDEPGYYRLKMIQHTRENGEVYYIEHTMKHYNGMPYFNRYNERCYNNYVSRAFHDVLRYCRYIKDQIFAEKQAIKDRKEETYNRLKNKRVMQNVIARQKEKERLKRVRGIVPTKATTAFFQALAVGSAISKA